MYHTLQGRHGEFEPGKVQYSTPNFFDQLFLIEIQNLGKQGPGLGALQAVAPLFQVRGRQTWIEKKIPI